MVAATVVGSYPRIGDTTEEQRLRRTIARVEDGRASEAELREVERSVIADVVREQADAGISLATDGQVTWYDSQSHFARRLDGFEVTGLARYFDTNTYYRQPRVTGPIRWREPITVDDWKAAASVSRVPVKAVLTGPYTLASLADTNGRRKGDLVREIAEALAQEVRALRAAGAETIQLDEPALTRAPEDVPLLAEGVETIAAEKGPARLLLFVFFGDVATAVRDLARLPLDGLGLDLVQGRANWKAVASAGDVPLTLGVVDARNTKRDDPAALAREVVRHGEGAVALDQAAVSPSNGLEFLPRARAREKLRFVAETAAIVEGEL